MSTGISALDMSLEMASDLSAYRYRLIKVGTDGKIALIGAATDIPVGIMQDFNLAKNAATIRPLGVSKLIAGEAITAGDLIKVEYVDATDNGKGLVADAIGDFVVGQALTSAAEDEFFDILIGINTHIVT